MNLPRRLLELSQALVSLEARRPRQATLRRAISTAYYSLFHLLVSDYTALFSTDSTIQAAIGRTVNHRDLFSVARDFSLTPLRLPEALKAKGIVATPELLIVVQAFISLQDERHDADYDVLLTYTRSEANAIIRIAQNAFAAWNIAKTTPAARIFLSCFQLKKVWDEKR